MEELILFVIGCVASMCLIVLSMFAGCILCQKYELFCYNRNNQNLRKSCDEIDINDIKLTAITLSQHSNYQPKRLHHSRNQPKRPKRSQSDPDILPQIDSVALAIESPEQINSEKYTETMERTHSSETIETEESDDEYHRSLSPLATPKSPTNAKMLQYPSHNAQITPFIGEEVNKSAQDSSLMSQIINMIDSESEEIYCEQKQEEEIENDSQNDSRVAITRMIVGQNVRIISDESVITSILSTNLSCSTNESEYAAFMNKSIENNEYEYVKEQKIVEEDDNSDDYSSTTITYTNSIEDYNKLHEIAAITTKKSCENILNHHRANTHLDKLNEVDELQLKELNRSVKPNEDNCEEKQNLGDKTQNVKQKIYEYKKKIKNSMEISERKAKRNSVTELKLNRVVKTTRPLFENTNSST